MSSPDGHVRVAIAHDYLTQRGGAERVVLTLAKAFPGAPIYTTLYHPPETFRDFAALDVRTTWLNRIGFFRRHHRAALPFLPNAVSHLTIDADVVLVSSSGWAHGVKTTGVKLVYCYTPARWLYQTHRYLGDHPTTSSDLALKVLGPWLRRWDARAARTAAAYISTSSVVQDRVHTAYALPSIVIPAPRPDTDSVEPEAIAEVEAWLDGHPYEICVSRLLPYKNVDQIIEAYAHEPDRRLVVVGRGPQEAEFQAKAGDNVYFCQDISDAELAWLYRGSRALLAISYEDFGLTPLEAASFGKPCIVLRWGGFVETMVEDVTAVFIDVPDAAHVREALVRLDARTWDPEPIIAHAAKYHESVFIETMRKLVAEHLPAG
jgi:glycosyltransferase involved in cell wall biosynthesis